MQTWEAIRSRRNVREFADRPIADDAASLGIGSGHAGVADQDMARGVLGFPVDRFCAYLLSFGYPEDRPLDLIRRPDRRPFSDVVHRDRW